MRDIVSVPIMVATATIAFVRAAGSGASDRSPAAIRSTKREEALGCRLANGEVAAGQLASERHERAAGVGVVPVPGGQIEPECLREVRSRIGLAVPGGQTFGGRLTRFPQGFGDEGVLGLKMPVETAGCQAGGRHEIDEARAGNALSTEFLGGDLDDAFARLSCFCLGLSHGARRTVNG
ncbi:hypothetical protein [Mycoplana sp. MJR14]|uniref:hypothetical protein n=1 Tax=Mycoplana sp. MJR14 TaxID=3032583 RepID=UPI0023DA6717|nr:hypothetical protein [Mycoplana sp. MJR14]MDF1635447.1 hypothetical protein [Mycoplana sp. MJR14]